MERVSLKNRWLIGALAAWAAGATGTLRADTVMAPAPRAQKAAGPSETYPESRFGRGPAKVDTGVDGRYAAREADEWDSGDPTGDRRPAGMTVGGSKADAKGEMQTPELESASMRRKGVQEIAIIAGDLGYFPKTVFVTRDIPVRLFVTGASKNSLCLMMDSFQVRKQIRSQRIEEITFTPSQPGKYRFYCPVNGMEGTMIVKELSQVAGN